VALLDFVTLYVASDKEGVLRIPQGVGFLQDYGLLSTIVGDVILIYLVRRYYDAICSARTSKAVKDPAQIDEPITRLTSMMRMDRRYRQLMYLVVVIGTAFWMSNLGFHLFGNPETHWGHKVFDSKDHVLTFIASRVHNVYTWSLVVPFAVYGLVFCSVQLQRVFASAVHAGSLKYDLLNPDQRGGFSFVDKSQLFFNLVISMFYVQIVLHIGTFERMNIEHYLSIAVATLLLIFGNRIFLGNIYTTINILKVEALNAIKDNVYENDKLSFEILKYCYERRINRYSLWNILTKSIAVVVSAGTKLYPLLEKAITRS